MNAITATELELLECFGAEPVLAEPEIPWCYTDATYTFEVDGLPVSFTVNPSYRDIRLVVSRKSRPFYELKAIGVDDVRILDFPGCDVFEIWLSAKEWLRIQIRPAFNMIHGFEKLPSWTGV